MNCLGQTGRLNVEHVRDPDTATDRTPPLSIAQFVGDSAVELQRLEPAAALAFQNAIETPGSEARRAGDENQEIGPYGRGELKLPGPGAGSRAPSQPLTARVRRA